MLARTGHLVLLSLVALSGCATQQPGPKATDQHPTKDRALEGRTFLSTSVTADGKPWPLVARSRVVVEFDERGLSLEAGCNRLFARARYADGYVTTSTLMTTDIGCDPARMSQDEWLAGFLTDDPQYTLESDRLTLSAGDRVIQLVPE